jgi:hypothetical protein
MYKYYDVCLVKDGLEWYYTKTTLEEVIELIEHAKRFNQEIKYIRGRKK